MADLTDGALLQCWFPAKSTGLKSELGSDCAFMGIWMVSAALLQSAFVFSYRLMSQLSGLF
ncbi:MAG: hypothetical protein K0U52_12810 [Gammaproteobacteria bacterium]|nr:hypothetical protein [Gammaproteobacteria bacterium]